MMLVKEINKSKYNITVISNVIFEPHLKPLMELYFGDDITVCTVPFEECMQQEYIKKINTANMVVIWPNFEAMFTKWRSLNEVTDFDVVESLFKKMNTYVASITRAKILWFLFEDYEMQLTRVTGYVYFDFVDKLNLKLKEIISEQVVFIDLKKLIAKIGVSNAYDLKGKYRWNSPYSKVLIEAAVKEIHKQYLIQKGFTPKCLVLDCDNVLWGGVVSEVGIENIKLGSFGEGRRYKDFQRFVYSLYVRGVILAICSKNDLSDVLEVFRNHNDMVLKEEHIACFQVNWENKAYNIKVISEILNIGLDTMVFVDDSIFEIESINSILPEVTTVLFEKELNFEEFSCFNLKNDVNMIGVRNRTATYQTDKYRRELRLLCDTYEEYVLSLKIKMDIHKAMPIEYGRIAELSQRTNKCTNGIRYTVDEIKEKVKNDKNILYAIEVEDRFSDLGLVGAIEIENGCLSFFALSCRALGRNIENKILDFVFLKHIINSAIFVHTKKNESLLNMINGYNIPTNTNQTYNSEIEDNK